MTKAQAIKKANDDLFQLMMLKSKLMTEIKVLEQQYKRNLSAIADIQENQSDISADIQKKFDRMQADSDKLDNFKFKHKIGEFDDER